MNSPFIVEATEALDVLSPAAEDVDTLILAIALKLAIASVNEALEPICITLT